MESKRNMAGGFRELTVYKKAFALAMDIFEITKKYKICTVK